MCLAIPSLALRACIKGHLAFHLPKCATSNSASEAPRFCLRRPRWRFGLVLQFFWNGPYLSSRRIFQCLNRLVARMTLSDKEADYEATKTGDRCHKIARKEPDPSSSVGLL